MGSLCQAQSVCQLNTAAHVTTPPFLQVQINLKGKKLEHHGIRVEFVGQIEMFYDRGNHHDFLSLVRQLDPPGELNVPSKTFKFDFQQVEKPYESYTGTNVRLRSADSHITSGWGCEFVHVLLSLQIFPSCGYRSSTL